MYQIGYRSILLLTSGLALSPVLHGAAAVAEPKVLDTDSSDSTGSETMGAVVTLSAQVPSVPVREQKVSRPSEHLCPITQDVMKDPVVAEDGFSYERAAILKWVSEHHTSPMTRKAMSGTFHPNQSLKQLIEEWNPKQTLRPSALAELSADAIVDLLKEEFAKNKRLLEPEHTASGKDIVVFLGNTGAGKSTLINFLAGKELSVVGQRYALANEGDPDAMPIGMKMFKSETLYPKSIDIGNYRFFDLPGFNDTDGSVRNLVNSAFIRRILLEAKSVRFVYVAGQDQFTADRGSSVNVLIQMIQRLLVMRDAGSDPINEGLFVITKEDQLLEDVISNEHEGIPLQVRAWHKNDHIDRMYHSSNNVKNTNEHLTHLLERIAQLTPLKLSTVNVSELYPPETTSDIERMYTRMFETAYEQKRATEVTTISEYDRLLEEWKDESFWDKYERGYFREANPSVETLRDLTLVPYQKAFISFKQMKGIDREQHIQWLEQQKRDRILVVQKDTEHRAEEVTSALRLQQGLDGVVPFDFANHVEYQERVCGKQVLAMFTPDEKEHEIARYSFAQWIGRYYQRQMDEQIRKLLQIQIVSLIEQVASLSAEFAKSETSRKEFVERNNKEISLIREAFAKKEIEYRVVADSQQRLEQQLRLQNDVLVPMQRFLEIPEIARGHEEIYRRFFRGKLVYRPDPNSDVGLKEFKISDLANPFSGTFDISGCGDTAQYLSISTGFRRAINPANRDKIEVWITPRFVIDKDPAAHRTALRLSQEAQLHGHPYLVLFSWGGWDNLAWYEVSAAVEYILGATFYDQVTSKSSHVPVRCAEPPSKCSPAHAINQALPIRDALIGATKRLQILFPQ